MIASPSTGLRPPPIIVGNTGNAIIGAIRWDAWHQTPNTIRSAVEASLGPAQYHWRAPFFAVETGSNSITISGGQAEMDAEIAYAVEAGLDYWAFFWYGTGSVMQQAWQYYQASADKLNINWCLYYSGLSLLHSEVTNKLAEHVAYMQQTNYQKVLTNRPVVFVYDGGESRADLAADIVALRAAVVAAGLGTPYIAMHQVTPNAADLSTYGLNATTRYAGTRLTLENPTPNYALDSLNRNFWNRQAAQAIDVVPTIVMGWDRRARVENPVFWETPSGTLSDYYYPEYTTDPAAALDAMLAWMRATPARVPANVAILYGWNEHDEGGVLCPTLIPSGGINRSKVDALAQVLL